MVKDKGNMEKRKDTEQILLTYCWGNTNAGDKVITKGTILSLRKVYPDAKIVIWHISPEKDSSYKESKAYIEKIDSNIKLMPNPVKSYRDTFHISFIPTICKKIRNKKSNLYELFKSDLIMFNCGHYFFWDSEMPGKWTKLLASYPLFLANKFDIPYGFYPHSFGPFNFRLHEKPIKSYYEQLFSEAKFLFTRESLSKKNLENEFANNLEIRNSIDAGFFVDAQKKGARRILEKYNLKDDQFIAMTLRLSKRGSGKKLEQRKYSEYADKLKLCIEKLIEKYDHKIALVCQVPSDKIHSENIVNRLPDNLQENCEIINEKLEPETLEALYGESKLLIGMRFHSLIFALNVGTPVIGIYYYHIGPKICGLLNDFGWSNLEFDLKTMKVGSLIQQVDNVLNNKVELKIEEKVEKRKQDFLSYLEKIRKISS